MDAIFSSALDRAWCPLRNRDNCDFGDSGEGEKNQGLIADQTFRGGGGGQRVLAIAQALAEIFTTSQCPYCTSRAFYSLSLSHAIRLPKPIPTISDYLITRKRDLLLALTRM